MKTPRLTLLMIIVSDFKIQFRKGLYSSFQDLVNNSSSAPPDKGYYIHSNVCPMLNNLYISKWHCHFHLLHMFLVVWQSYDRSPNAYVNSQTQGYVQEIKIIWSTSINMLYNMFNSHLLACLFPNKLVLGRYLP